MLPDMYTIPGLRVNLFNLVQALQKGFQGTSEGKSLVLKKITPEFGLTRKLPTSVAEGFYHCYLQEPNQFHSYMILNAKSGRRGSYQ